MSSTRWTEQTRLAAAAAAAAAGLVVAGISLFQPAWLRLLVGSSPQATTVELPQEFRNGLAFSEQSLDTFPSDESMDSVLVEFERRIAAESKNVGLTQEQLQDLSAAANERLQSILAPDIERDYDAAKKRGLSSPKAEIVAQAKKYGAIWQSRKLSPFSLSSTTIVPLVPRANRRFELLSHIEGVTCAENRLPSPPSYPSFDPNALRVEVLVPLLTPGIDILTGKFSTTEKAVVVFGFRFTWSEAERRWLPSGYHQYELPEADRDIAIPGYPMAF